MADNTIDSLEIKIESSADQAVRSLENLSAKLTTIKNTLGNTNVGFDLSGISKTKKLKSFLMMSGRNSITSFCRRKEKSLKKVILEIT